MANTNARRLRRLHLQPFDRSGQVAEKRGIRKELKDLKAATGSQRAELRETFLRDLLARKEYKNAVAAIDVYQRRRSLQIDPPTPAPASLEGLARELRQKIFEKLLEDDELSDDRRPHALVAQRTKIALVCRKLRDDMEHVEKIWRQRMAVLSALYAPERANFERIARSLTQVMHQTRAVDRHIKQERNRRNNLKKREKRENRENREKREKREKKEKRLGHGGGGFKAVPNDGHIRSNPGVALKRAERGRDRLDDFPSWAGTRKTFDD